MSKLYVATRECELLDVLEKSNTLKKMFKHYVYTFSVTGLFRVGNILVPLVVNEKYIDHNKLAGVEKCKAKEVDTESVIITFPTSNCLCYEFLSSMEWLLRSAKSLLVLPYPLSLSTTFSSTIVLASDGTVAIYNCVDIPDFAVKDRETLVDSILATLHYRCSKERGRA